MSETPTKQLPAQLFTSKFPSNSLETTAALVNAIIGLDKPKKKVPSVKTQQEDNSTKVSDIKDACHICAIAGISYLFKIISLYRSLEAYSDNFVLYVCCIDDTVCKILRRLNLRRCIPISLNDIENGIDIKKEDIESFKNTRKKSEFCWTIKSIFMLHLLKKYNLPSVLYCDSDMYFFSDPRILYEDWGNSSVYLCTQRDLDWVEEKYGKYQAGIIGFRNDETGLGALSWWSKKCRQWCFAYEDTEYKRWGDQKYLDELASLYDSVKTSTHAGINAAPWNVIYNNDYKITHNNGITMVDGVPLVAFHFACLDMFSIWQFDLWNLSEIQINNSIKGYVYVPYLQSLQESYCIVKRLVGNSISAFLSKRNIINAKTPYLLYDYGLSLSKWNGEYAFCTISSRTYVAKTLALYSSLKKHAGNFHIWICCMDMLTYKVLKSFRLTKATLINVRKIETAECLRSKHLKKLNEYCWTLKPFLCSYIFRNYNVKRLLYCDSDMYFLSSPDTIHKAWTAYQTFMNLQLGTEILENKHGLYQAGLIGFTKASDSLRILKWWKNRCAEWCFDNHEDPDRWGDQKYLQRIPDLFINIKVNRNYGILAAPWNIVMNNTQALTVTREGDDVFIGDEKVTCYHFGSITIYNENEFDLWRIEPMEFSRQVLDCIYKPYLNHIRNVLYEIKRKGFNLEPLFADPDIKCMNSFKLD